ncbi:MAG: tetratricopeptide repeat protein [Gemmataceae bacterium]|nr:tetratricopeptide repeat protein [Gemmataceae bacterium]
MIAGVLAGVLLAAGPADFGPTDAKKDALARYGAGLWQARRDRLLSAAKSHEAAAKQDPEAVAPRRELVKLYAQLGREPDAVKMARAVLAKEPHDAETAHTLATLLADAGELKEAVAAAKLAAEHLDPDTRPDRALAVLRDLAALINKAGEPAAAVAPLRTAAELFTDRKKAVVASGYYTAAEADAEAADTLERLGKVLVKAGKPADAVTAFQSAAKLAAEPAVAARLDWNLSAAHQAAGDPAAALARLEAFLKLKPIAVEPYERYAKLLRDTGRAAAVVPSLQRLSERDPKNLPLRAVLAAEAAGDPDARPEADALFGRLAAETADPKVVRVAVRSHVETGRANLILADLDRVYKVLKPDRDDPPAEGDTTFAADRAAALTEALRAEPDWTAAVLRAAADDLRAGTTHSYPTWHLLGTLAGRAGKLDLAAAQFRQAVQAAPFGPARVESYARLMDILWRLRRHREIADLCREGLRARRSGVAEVFFNYHLAYALAELGEADAALAAADAAIAQAGDTDRLAVRLRKVYALKSLGRWDEAVQLGKRLLAEADPGDRNRVRYVLAAALWGAGDRTAAEAELRAILDADPDHAGACNDLGYHLAEQGRDLPEAERLIRNALAIDRADRRKAGDPEPENAAYLDSLGWVLFRKGDLPAARAALEKASAIPDGAADAVVWDHLGDVLFRLGEKSKAKAVWEKAAGMYQTDPRGKRDGRADELAKKLKRVS